MFIILCDIILGWFLMLYDTSLGLLKKMSKLVLVEIILLYSHMPIKAEDDDCKG